MPSPALRSVMSVSHSSFGAVAVNSRRMTPCSSTNAHRSSWAGAPGLFALLRLGLPNADHQPLSEQIRHAVRWAIATPASAASSTRNR